MRWWNRSWSFELAGCFLSVKWERSWKWAGNWYCRNNNCLCS